MLKSALAIAAGAVMTLSGVIAPEAAKAMTCTSSDDLSMCMDYQYTDGNGDQVWYVVITNQHTTERVNVTCDGDTMVRWNSRGGGTQAEVDRFARAFCAL